MKKLKNRESIVRLSLCIAAFFAALVLWLIFRPKTDILTLIESRPDAEISVTEQADCDIVGMGIQPISVPKIAKRGSKASVTFKGEPNTEYEIRVYYASGLSEAKSFAPTVSDAEGNFSWTWNVSGNARPGDIRIIVTGESCRVSFPLEITE